MLGQDLTNVVSFLFVLFYQYLGTNTMRHKMGRAGWTTGGVEPEVSYEANCHVNQCDMCTQACLPMSGLCSQCQTS